MANSMYGRERGRGDEVRLLAYLKGLWTMDPHVSWVGYWVGWLSVLGGVMWFVTVGVVLCVQVGL